MRRLTLLAPLLPALALAQAPSLPDRADALVKSGETQVLAWRRDFHEHPELSYQESRTSAAVAKALAAMPGMKVQAGLAKTGVKGVLVGGRPGPVVALRADMDALPIVEREKKPYRSGTPGVMHACGHDGHVAILLNLAEATRKQGLQGKALHYYRQALTLEPDNQYAIAGEGMALVEKGAVEKARRNLTRLQQLCGKSDCAPAQELAAAIDKGPPAQVAVSVADVQAAPTASPN